MLNLKLKNIVDNLSIGFIVRKQLRPIILDDGNLLDHIEKFSVTPHEILYSTLFISIYLFSLKDEIFKKKIYLRQWILFDVIFLTFVIILTKNVKSVF
jgi:membrane protein CcdC involved in cytochrome C biogenesis